MLARRLRAVTVLAAALVAVTAGCVRGRNDGGRDAAGLSSNGAGPAPEPGPLGGQNKDTSLAPTAAPAPVAPAAGAPAPASATKKP